MPKLKWRLKVKFCHISQFYTLFIIFPLYCLFQSQQTYIIFRAQIQIEQEADMRCQLQNIFKLELPPSMSAKLTLDNICIKNNPALFTQQIQFQVTFTTLDALIYPITWKIIYVGSAISQDYDQTLQQFEIDPILTSCTSKFQISCAPPNAEKIPRKQLLCVTALILTASYRDQQFIRVGYYVHNQLDQQITLEQSQQISVKDLVSHIRRTIISDKPRITKFNIQWNSVSETSQREEQIQPEPVQASLDYYFKKLGQNSNKAIQYQNICKSSQKQLTQQGDSLSMMKCQ